MLLNLLQIKAMSLKMNRNPEALLSPIKKRKRKKSKTKTRKKVKRITKPLRKNQKKMIKKTK